MDDDDMKLQRRGKLPRTSVDQTEGCSEEGPGSINQLPDALLLDIIALLPLKQAVQTSILSRRWEHLWKSIPNVQFHYSDSWKPVEFQERAACVMETFLRHHQASKIRRFDVDFTAHEDNAHLVDSWVLFALSHGVEEFLFRCARTSYYGDYKMPCCVFQNRGLVELRLVGCEVQMPSSVCLPLLKTLYLRCVGKSATVLEFILSGCPSLESLTILNCCYGQRLVISVGSLYLRSLTIEHKSQIVIDAPTLQFLELQSRLYLPEDCLFRNLSPSIRISLKSYGFMPVGCYGLMKIFDQLHHVRYVQLSEDCYQALYMHKDLKPFLATCLEIEISLTTSTKLRNFQSFLSFFPEVEALILVFKGLGPPLDRQKCWESVKNSVSKLMLHIKTIEFHDIISANVLFQIGKLDDLWRVGGAKIKLLCAVLEKSSCLEKVVITLNRKHRFEEHEGHRQFKLKLIEMLQGVNRTSPAAKIFVY